MSGSADMRIVMVGKTGSGKSSLANTMFGEELFKTSFHFRSETKKCQSVTKMINDRLTTVVDTPGFFDTDLTEEEHRAEIMKCITECAPGPHVFLVVIKCERYTKHEQATITEITQTFSDEVFKYAIVVFTHGDQLGGEGGIEKLVREYEVVKELVGKCGGRCHVVDNKYWNKESEDEYRSNKFQVGELVKTMGMLMETHGGRCYTNAMLQEVENYIKIEMERVRLSKENEPEAEIRVEAKKNIFEKLLIQLAGIGTGALLGAFFGAAALKAVMEALQNQNDAFEPGLGGWVRGWLRACVALISAAIGAISGALTGYRAARTAESPGEAAAAAANSVGGEGGAALAAMTSALDSSNQNS